MSAPHGSQAFQPLPEDRPVRVGVLGTGWIAATVTEDMLTLPDDFEVVAVGSRTQRAASAFADRFGIGQAYGSWAALAASDVDLVYVTTPHQAHLPAAELCLKAGKHVLCEKPLTDSALATRDLVECARAHDRFLMEAVWMRCQPLVQQALALVRAGRIGHLRHVRADLCFAADVPDDHRLLNPDLAGGAILDLGVYPLHAINLFTGTRTPVAVSASGWLARTGVDAGGGMQLTFGADGPAGPLVAQAFCALDAQGSTVLHLFGTEGTIVIEGYQNPTTMRLTCGEEPDAVVEDFESAAPGNGYVFELLEVARCLRLGRAQSAMVPWQATTTVADWLDQWLAGVHSAGREVRDA